MGKQLKNDPNYPANSVSPGGPQFDYQYPNPFVSEQEPGSDPGNIREAGDLRKYGEVAPGRRTSRWSGTRRLFLKPDGSGDAEAQAAYDSDKVATMWEPGDPVFFSGNPQKDEEDYNEYMTSKMDKLLTKEEFNRLGGISKDLEGRMKAGDPALANVTDPSKEARRQFYQGVYRRDFPSYSQYVNRYYKKPVAPEEKAGATQKAQPSKEAQLYRSMQPEYNGPVNFPPAGKRKPVNLPKQDSKKVERYNDRFSGRPGPGNKAVGSRVVRRRPAK